MARMRALQQTPVERIPERVILAASARSVRVSVDCVVVLVLLLVDAHLG